MNGREKKFISLEVELSSKTKDSYLKIGSYYSFQADVDSVIWVTKNEAFGRRISKLVNCRNHTDDSIHNFVSLVDFMDHGWNSKVFLGNFKGKTINKILGRTSLESSKDSNYQHFFEFRKNPINSRYNDPKKILKI